MRFWHQPIYRVLFALLAALATFWVLTHNASWYTQPIGQITDVQITDQYATEDEHGNRDEIQLQQLTVQLLNADGQVQFNHQTNRSQAFATTYQAGQQVLLQDHHGSYQLIGLKRDAIIGALAVLVAGILWSYRGGRTFYFLMVSLAVNLALFMTFVWFNVHLPSPPVLALFVTAGIVMAISSLWFVLGRSWQMLVTLVATLLATSLTALLAWGIMLLTNQNGIHFETLSYVTQTPIAIFNAMLLIGLLGAVMDEAGDIVAAVFGMARQTKKRTWQAFYQSGCNVGRDIMGTLINVLFLLFVAETLPMVFLFLRNGNDWSTIFGMVMNLGILQTVVSAIGIVLAVPVTSAVAATALWHLGGRHE